MIKLITSYALYSAYRKLSEDEIAHLKDSLKKVGFELEECSFLSGQKRRIVAQRGASYCGQVDETSGLLEVIHRGSKSDLLMKFADSYEPLKPSRAHN